MALTERLALLITGDTSDAVRAIGDLERTSSRSLGATENRATRLGGTLTRTLTPAALGAGAAFGIAFQEFDAGADALRAAGATGDEFTDSMKKVGNQVPASLGEVGTVMGELYQRTKLTGEPLEELTQQVLELGEVGQNVDVNSITRMFGDWSIGAEDFSSSLDMVYRVSQETGTTVSRLTELTVQYGGPLRQLGFEFEDATLMMAKFEAEGVNTELVAGSLRTALGRMAKAGEEPIETFQRVTEEIKNAGSSGEANALALEMFGARAGPDMAAAIREGRFELGELRADLDANTDTIHDAAAGTRDWQETLAMAQNRLIGIAGPVGQYGMALSGLTAALGPALSGVGKLSDSHPKLMSTIGQTGAVVGGAAAVWASYTMMMDNARETADKAAAGIHTGIIESVQTTDDLGAAMQRLSTETIKMSREVDESISPLDADYRESLNRMIDANNTFRADSEKMILQAEEVAEGFGISEDSAIQWLLAQYQLGNEFGTSSAALDAYGQVVDENNGLTTEQTQSIEESTAALDEWQSAVRAQFDPMFALNQAIQTQREAQEAANGATWLYGPASAEAQAANLELAEANLSASAASAQLAEGISNGTVSLEESAAVIDGWVASGQMSEEQAESVRTQFFLLGLEADRLDGRDVKMTVSTSYVGVPPPVALGGGIKAFDSGGIVPGAIGSPQLILAHGGETVLPTHKTGKGSMSAENIVIENHLYLDGERVEAVVTKHQRKKAQARI